MVGLGVTKLLGLEVHLDPKVNVVSRFARGAEYPKSVGSRGFFEIDPALWISHLSH